MLAEFSFPAPGLRSLLFGWPSATTGRCRLRLRGPLITWRLTSSQAHQSFVETLKLPFCAVEFAFASAVDMWALSWGLLQSSGLEFSWSPQGTCYRLNRDHQMLVKEVNEHMPLHHASSDCLIPVGV